MSVTIRRLFGVASALLVLGGVSVPGPASAQSSPAPVAVQPCAPSELSLREAPAADDAGSASGVVYVLRNGGAAACRLSGGVGIRLFDANGNAIPLRFAPRTMMAMLLTLAPSAEASFTLSFGAHDLDRCAVATRIEVSLPGGPAAVSAPTTIVACSDALATVSNLRLGVAAKPATPALIL